MKRIFGTILLFTVVTLANAQSDKYTSAMAKQIATMENGYQTGDFTPAANSFERIAQAEKEQWLPYYYAAYCYVMQAYMDKDNSKKDAIADKADSLIRRAEVLAGGENSEICVIKSMIASAHMMVDPQSRWMQYGQASSAQIEKAKQLDPTNPRPVYLEAQSKFYTPEQFGGGKSVAAPLFEKSIAMFDAFQPQSSLHPTWGKRAAEYFLAQCK